MWSSLLLADAGSDPVLFSGVSVVPAGDPIVLADAVDRADVDHLLVVAPRSLVRPLRFGVTIAAGRRPNVSLTWLVSEHAPLAILSALALARAATDEPAIGVELTQRVLAGSWSGAWTNSVAKLGEPNPRLTQHLRSMLPGSGFLIRQAPLPSVLGKARTDDVPGAGLDRILLVEDGAVPAPIAQRLSTAERVTAVRQVTLPGSWTSVYGTDRTGQLALMPADPQTLIGPVGHTCPSCRLRQIGVFCPYCRIVNHRLAPAVPVSSSLAQLSSLLVEGERTNSGRAPQTSLSAPKNQPGGPA